MAVEMWKKANSDVVHLKVQDKLSEEDYDQFVPELDKAIAEHDKIKLLFEMENFEGWEAGALWEDLKFDLAHFNDVDKLAMVGEEKWHKGMALFTKPFTSAEVEYFELGNKDKARQWLEN